MSSKVVVIFLENFHFFDDLEFFLFDHVEDFIKFESRVRVYLLNGVSSILDFDFIHFFQALMKIVSLMFNVGSGCQAEFFYVIDL